MRFPGLTKLLEHLTHRGDVLQCLQEGMDDSRRIADEVAQSRSTVDRDVRLLKDDNLIRECPVGYELTNYGGYALEIHQQATSLARLDQLVPRLPPDVPVTVLRSATVMETGGTLPREPVDAVVDSVKGADRVRVAVPTVVPVLAESLLAQVRDDGLRVDLVVTVGLLDDVGGPRSEAIRTCFESEACRLRYITGDLSFGLVIVDDERTFLFVYDDQMRLLGVVANDSDTAVEWALDTFRTFREQSEDAPGDAPRTERPG